MSTTQPTAAKLTDSQLVILSAAGQRADGSMLPFPQSLSVKGGGLGKVVETLCRAGDFRRLMIEARKSAGLTQLEVAKRLKRHQSFVANTKAANAALTSLNSGRFPVLSAPIRLGAQEPYAAALTSGSFQNSTGLLR